MKTDAFAAGQSFPKVVWSAPFEEELHDTEEKCEWCEKYCGKASAADCWMRYFQLKYNEKEGNTNE